ncbi:MAG TPA: NrfD/PsrC family molybdoenzyme membrane anchor subunit [Syntrophomonas sp.]|nr:NrfD/PsrC family molybdoenzyme membrane anchor subunit [Syntrophomonas sp.]
METKQEYWGGLAALSFFLVATGAMMLLVMAAMDLLGAEAVTVMNGWGSLAALVMAAIGGLCLMVEAGNKAKAYLIVANPSSMASRNAIMMTLLMGFAFVYATFFFDFIPWVGWTYVRALVAAVGIIAALLAVIVPAMELGESRGRGFWNASGLIPAFIITSLAGGTGAVLIVAAALGLVEDPALVITNKVFFVFLILQLVTVIGYVKGMKNSGASEARTAAKNILEGEFKNSFWGCVIIAGTIIPLILFISASPAAIIIKSILVLIGGVCFRNVFLAAGIRKAIPGEENEWVSREEAARLAISLEKRWQEKKEWLYPR